MGGLVGVAVGVGERMDAAVGIFMGVWVETVGGSRVEVGGMFVDELIVASKVWVGEGIFS